VIGVIVATHSRLAQELLRAAEMIIGPFALVEPVSIGRGDSVDAGRRRMQRSFDRVASDGDGVIILTDMFGGTPTNISADFLAAGQVEILTGVNLPMLLKCINARGGMPLEALAGMLKEYARNAVMRPSELLGR
jgi:PTS system mannose-specific IIA component